MAGGALGAAFEALASDADQAAGRMVDSLAGIGEKAADIEEANLARTLETEGKVAQDFSSIGSSGDAAGARAGADAARVSGAPAEPGTPGSLADTPPGPVTTSGVGGCGKAGEPVDVVTGQYVTATQDVALPGVLALILRRAYASGYRGGRLFGPGWASTLDQRVEIGDDGIHYAGDDAQILAYPVPTQPGQRVMPADGARWPLTWDRQADEIRVQDTGHGWTLHFTTLGATRTHRAEIRRLTSVSDRNGNRITFVRDDDGVPLEVQRTGGYRIGVDAVHTSGGLRVESLRLLDGANGGQGTGLVIYQYDPRGRLVGVVDSTGVPFVYEYDADDRITAWIDRVGHRFEYEYDEAGRVVRTRGQDGYLSGSFAYDPGNRVTTYTDSLGHATWHHYDALGHVHRIVDPLGREIRTERDRYGRVLETVDGLGHTTRYVLDEHGNTARIERADGTSVQVEYNQARLPVATTAPDGARWRYEYDERGNCTAVIDPVDAVTRFAYNDRGALLSQTDALGHTLRFEPDAAGLPLSATSDLGERTRVERDAFGRIVASTDPLGAVTRVGWTVEGKPAWRVNADGTREEWTYDGRGDLIEYRNALGHTVQYEYGCFGLPTARTDPDGRRYTFEYDTECRIRTVTNPQGLSWRYAYDPAGRLASETDFNGRTVTYGYDDAGRLASRICGQTASRYQRDSLGRIIEATTGDQTVRYTFDPAGRLIAAVSPTSQLTFSRDRRGRILAETVDGRTVVSEYDPLGSRIRRITPAEVVSQWAYDAYGQPTSLAGTAGSLSFQYDAAGQETTRYLGARTALTQTFDVMGHLTGQGIWDYPADSDLAGHGTAQTEPAYQPLQQRTYTYRPDGHLISIRDALAGDRDFDLDPFGRVTAITGANWTENYAYSAAGTLSSAQISGAAQHDDVLGPREFTGTRVREAARTSYEYDEQGRVTRTIRRTLSGQRRIWQYTWNDLDQLTAVDTSDGERWTYSYDPLGRRTGKRRLDASGEHHEETIFTWDGTRVAEEQHLKPDGGERTRTWDYRPGTLQPLAQTERRSGDLLDQSEVDQRFYAIVADLAGSPSELVAADGTIAWRRTASLWGLDLGSGTDERATSAAPDCPLRFPGQYHDAETGWDYNFFRYYDPALGRYTSPDPLGLVPGPDQYGYVPNPCARIDPLGLADDPLAIAAPKPVLALPAATGEPPNIGPILSREALPGEEFNMVLSAGQPNTRPGGFGTFDDVPNQSFAREQLAIRTDWKGDVSKLQRYRFPDGDPIRIQESIVGPQMDPNLGRELPGGATQLEILNPADRARLIPVGDPVDLPC